MLDWCPPDGIRHLKDKPVGVVHRALDGTFAEQKTGWTPRISFAEGARRTVEWYTANHRPADVAAIRAAGAKLFFLPKYSPDLNPIEQVFAKLKHLLRKAQARTPDAICQAIGTHLDAFTPQECANYFRNSGYKPNPPKPIPL